MTPKALHDADLIADNLALDFVNTSTGRHTSRDWGDSLSDAMDVLVWLRHAQAIDEARFREMTRVVANDDAKAGRFLTSSLRLRGALAALFAAFASESVPDGAAIEVLNAVLVESRTADRIAWTSEGVRIVASVDLGALDDALWPIARAAERLLTSESPRRVKRCGSPTCQWMFLDISKNGSRRWCQMEVCGNREKGRRRLKRDGAQWPPTEA